MTPEAFEIVVGAGGFREDMDDEIAVIHENPLGGIIAFDARRQLAGRLQLFSDLVCDGVGLAGVGNRADDEEIGEGGDLAKVEDG